MMNDQITKVKNGWRDADGNVTDRHGNVTMTRTGWLTVFHQDMRHRVDGRDREWVVTILDEYQRRFVDAKVWPTTNAVLLDYKNGRHILTVAIPLSFDGPMGLKGQAILSIDHFREHAGTGGERVYHGNAWEKLRQAIGLLRADQQTRGLSDYDPSRPIHEVQAENSVQIAKAA